MEGGLYPGEKPTADQKRAVAFMSHIKKMFGYHGGIGDPPSDDDIIAIIRGALEFAEIHEEKDNGVVT